MKLTSFLLGGIAFYSSFSFSQIDELKKAQEVRKAHFNRGQIVNKKHFTKTLYVNPFVGTGGHGHTYPGATAPFGMMQLSPDTRYEGWDGCSGYHYSDSIIYGFSHTHLSGTGVPDYCDLLIVPQSGKAITQPGYSFQGGYGSKFSHTNEKATPGFYSVHLDDENIDVRLTATERAGFHEYTFNNSSEKKYILIDLDHRDKLHEAEFTIIDKQTISGHRFSEAWAKNQHFYFHLNLDVPYLKAKLINKKGQHKLLLIFPTSTKVVNMKVGMSSVDTKGAQQNLEKEIPEWDFLKVQKATQRQWEKELSAVYFYSENEEYMYNFYTAMYHSFLAPNIFSDVDGRYMGRDMQIHQLGDSTNQHYTVFSLWDTYRATHPLFTLTQTKRNNDFIRTFLRQFEQGGDLPVWELAGNETECMIGYHSVSVMADAYLKNTGLSEIDKMIYAMKTTAVIDELGKKQFHEEGYIDAGSEPESVSKTLEYAYDDFCISQTIEAYNKRENQILENPFKLSQFNFINNFDPNTKFMRARRSGQWFAPFDPSEVNFNYTEANSWQYSLYAPHAVGVLRSLLGGKDSLEMWLDNLFSTNMELSGRHQVDITGLIGQYAHGNEPSHHMAYLYNYTNRPFKTSMYTTLIMNSMYQNAPDGLSGNEDCGQMSSWYVMTALGLYQIAPGNPYYELTRPLAYQASIKLDNGKTLNIITYNNNNLNIFIDSVYFNNKHIEGSYISHEEIMQGGTLVYKLVGSTTKAHMNKPHAPTIESIPNEFVSLPFFHQTEHVFTDSMVLSMGIVTPQNAKIYYTLDGSNPGQSSKLYDQPFTASNSVTVKAIAISEFGSSSITTNRFVKKDNNVSLNLKSTYDNQYAAGGPFSLIDGITGGNEYRTGDWQGFWEQDVVAEVSFKEPKSLISVGVNCLSDMKSWIFLPEEIIFEISTDGINYTTLKPIKLDPEEEKDMFPHRKSFSIPTNTETPIKNIRLRVKPTKVCPEWHLGSGNSTWLFLDEITFE
jgi:predicted alpha-1,2-mannosidase